MTAIDRLARASPPPEKGSKTQATGACNAAVDLKDGRQSGLWSRTCEARLACPSQILAKQCPLMVRDARITAGIRASQATMVEPLPGGKLAGIIAVEQG
jgi:hypothetical protein